MERITFTFDGMDETAEFYVLEQTMINGCNYILVTDSDSEEDDAECMILKDTGLGSEQDTVYEIVENDTELAAVSRVFEELLEDIDITM